MIEKRPVQIVKPVAVTRINSSGQIAFYRKNGPTLVGTVIIEVTGGSAKEREKVAKVLDMIGERVVEEYAKAVNAASGNTKDGEARP